MAKTLIDLDRALADEAATVLGTTTIKDTVHEALRRAVRQARHLETIAYFAEMTDEQRDLLKRARNESW